MWSRDDVTGKDCPVCIQLMWRPAFSRTKQPTAPAVRAEPAVDPQRAAQPGLALRSAPAWAPQPAEPPGSAVARAINERFNRNPIEAKWGASRGVPDAGVLLHLFDGWEDHVSLFQPQKGYSRLLSSSFIFSGQNTGSGSISEVIFGPRSGLIFKPEITRVACAMGKDAGGICHLPFCEPDNTAHSVTNYPGDGCQDSSWSPEHIGIFLGRVTQFQKAGRRSFYNEFLLDPKMWREALPDIIEVSWPCVAETSSACSACTWKHCPQTKSPIPLSPVLTRFACAGHLLSERWSPPNCRRAALKIHQSFRHQPG